MLGMIFVILFVALIYVSMFGLAGIYVACSLAGVAAVLCAIWSFCGTVPAGYFCATTYCGRDSRILRPGFYVLSPFENLIRVTWTELNETATGATEVRTRSITKFPLAADKFDPPALVVRTSDKQDMSLNCALWWRIVLAADGDKPSAPADFSFFDQVADPVNLMHEMYKQAARNVIGRRTCAELEKVGYDVLADELCQNVVKLMGTKSNIEVIKFCVQAIEYPKDIATKLAEEAKKRQTLEAEYARIRQEQEFKIAQQLTERKLIEEAAATAELKARKDAQVRAFAAEAEAKVQAIASEAALKRERDRA